MARPPEIRDDIHNRIKVYAVMNDITVPQAYNEVLESKIIEEELISNNSLEKLEKFCENNDIDRVEGVEILINSVIDEDGSIKHGTIVKNISSSKLNL